MPALIGWFQKRFDSRPLAIARIIVGLAALMKIFIFAPSIRRFFSSTGTMEFPVLFEPVIPRTETIALVLILLWVGFAALFLIGFWTRLAGAGLAIVILAVITFDQQLYSNHLYLLTTVVALLTLAGAGGRYSLDAWNDGARPSVPRWAATLLKLQLTSVYFFAAVSKLNSGFLEGTIFQLAFEPSMLQWIEAWVDLGTLAIAAIVTELFLAIAFWIPRVRWVALAAAIGFHLANVVIMDRGGAVNLFIFGMIMFSMMLVFFEDRFQPIEVAEASESPDEREIPAPVRA